MTAAPQNPAIGWFGAIVALTGFSMTGVWVRWLDGMNPLAIVGWRGAMALVVLVPAVLLTEGGSAAVRHLSRWSTHSVALRMTVFFASAVVAFQLAPVALVIMFIGTSPAWALLIERVAGKAIRRREAVGVAIVLVGAVTGLGPALYGAVLGEAASSSTAIGAALGLVSGFLAASYVVGRNVLGQQVIPPPNAFTFAMTTALWGLLLFPIAAASGRGALIPSDVQWLSAVGIGLVSTAAPLWGLATASRHLPPVVVTLVTPLGPFTGAALAFVFLGEVPPAAFALAIPFIMIGIGLVTGLLPPPARASGRLGAKEKTPGMR
ncbi:MAG: DMT family transporter [Myxococcota bacterium]